VSEIAAGVAAGVKSDGHGESPLRPTAHVE
jgi:hypothetical protein